MLETIKILPQKLDDHLVKNQGIGTKPVTPAYIAVVLAELEQQGAITVIGSKVLSNIVRIQIVP